MWRHHVLRLGGLVWKGIGAIRKAGRSLQARLDRFSHFSRRVHKKAPRECGAFFLVVAAGAGRRAAELGVAGSAQCGRTVWIAVRIAVVWMRLDHAVVGVVARLMTNCVCKCEGTGERERRGQCYCREFHVFVLCAVYTNSKWTFYLIIPLNSSLGATL